MTDQQSLPRNTPVLDLVRQGFGFDDIAAIKGVSGDEARRMCLVHGERYHRAVEHAAAVYAWKRTR